MSTVGRVVSGGGPFDTVTVTGSEVHETPRMSRATALSVCEPLLVAVVFQETEYGAAVSSAPIFAPSTLNPTPATVREPTMLTLALTWTVPDTVDPDVGDESVTIRLPRPGNGNGSDGEGSGNTGRDTCAGASHGSSSIAERLRAASGVAA